MQKDYMIVAFGTSKKTGGPYSRALHIRSDSKTGWGYLDEKDKIYLEEKRMIGDIVKVESKIV